jgi:hypothetical protein
MEWNERMICEWSIVNDLQQSRCDLIVRYYSAIRLEGLSETTKDLKWGQSVTQPRYEPGTCQISSNTNHSTTKFGTCITKFPSCNTVIDTTSLNYSNEISNRLSARSVSGPRNYRQLVQSQSISKCGVDIYWPMTSPKHSVGWLDRWEFFYWKFNKGADLSNRSWFRKQLAQESERYY